MSGAENSATVSLNLDAPFESQAAQAAAAGERLITTLDGIATASQKAAAVDMGIRTGGPAFSSANHNDFKRSKWDSSGGSPWQGWQPPKPPAAPPKPSAGGGSDGESGGGSSSGGAPKDLKYLLKQAGIGKAALGALGVAGGLELSKLALGQRGMAQLQGLTARAGLQVRQLFKGVDASPVTRAADRFFQIFSQATPAGKALASMLGAGFNGFFSLVERAEPLVSGFFKGMIVGGLRVQEAWYGLELAILPVTEALGGIDTSGVDGIALAADAGSVAFRALAVVIDATAAGIRATVEAYNALDAAVRRGSMSEAEQIRLGNNDRDRAEQVASDARNNAANPNARHQAFSSTNGSKPTAQNDNAEAAGIATGLTYGGGLAKGMDASADSVNAAGVRLGSAGDKGVRTGADAHSPSRKTEKTGRDMGAGVVVGMEATSGDVQASAATALVPRLPTGGAAGAGASLGGAGGRIVVEVHHHWPPGVERAQRRDVEDAGEAGTLRALRTMATEMGVPLELAS